MRLNGTRSRFPKNLTDWFLVATVTGQPSTIDIDAALNAERGTTALSGEQFSFVRATDVAGGAVSRGPEFAGPDIDAIGAISSGAPVDVPAVPLPASAWLLLGGVFGLRALRKRKS